MDKEQSAPNLLDMFVEPKTSMCEITYILHCIVQGELRFNLRNEVVILEEPSQDKGHINICDCCCPKHITPIVLEQIEQFGVFVQRLRLDEKNNCQGTVMVIKARHIC